MIPLIQKQLDEFKNMIWNPHRIRYQKETYMADGIPNHIYEFPEKYELEECGMLYMNNILHFNEMRYTTFVAIKSKKSKVI